MRGNSRILTIALLIPFLVFMMSFGRDSAAGAPGGEERSDIAGGNNAFTLALYNLLRTQDGNLFFSPFSIRTAFAMAYSGARGNTAEQMAAVLHFPKTQTTFHSEMGAFIEDLNGSGGRKYRLAIANALWGQKGYPFLEEFLKLNRENYHAGMKLVDFSQHTEQVRKTINSWIERKTANKIKDLLKPGILSSDTCLVITNAIFFKGTWVHQFAKENTQVGAFTTLAGNTVDVAFMRQTAGFGFYENSTLKLLEMPYKGDRIAMTILLPLQADGLPGLERALSTGRIERWLNGMVETAVDVKLPKFAFTSEFELSSALKSLGMVEAFKPGADFSGMTGFIELFISAVVHKALVDVNEKGTVAAGATAIVFDRTSMPQSEFHADHPFLFLIRDTTTGAILFMGRVADPSLV
jgi:serpin B